MIRDDSGLSGSSFVTRECLSDPSLSWLTTCMNHQ